MTELPIDLDSILAHLVPGLIALAGIAFLSPRLQRLFSRVQAEHSGSILLALTLGALVIGLVLSDIRSAVLHPTCRLNLSRISHEPSFAPIDGEPVAYDKLIKEGRLNAFHEAARNEQTPYRFHGNTLLAITFLVCSRIIALSQAARRGAISRRVQARGVGLAALLFLIALTVLYPAFRTRYYNYTNAIRAINSA
jgi:hypothetical protein